MISGLLSNRASPFWKGVFSKSKEFDTFLLKRDLLEKDLIGEQILSLSSEVFTLKGKH